MPHPINANEMQIFYDLYLVLKALHVSIPNVHKTPPFHHLFNDPDTTKYTGTLLEETLTIPTIKAQLHEAHSILHDTKSVIRRITINIV